MSYTTDQNFLIPAVFLKAFDMPDISEILGDTCRGIEWPANELPGLSGVASIYVFINTYLLGIEVRMRNLLLAVAGGPYEWKKKIG